jgi:hypothetical protein
MTKMSISTILSKIKNIIDIKIIVVMLLSDSVSMVDVDVDHRLKMIKRTGSTVYLD